MLKSNPSIFGKMIHVKNQFIGDINMSRVTKEVQSKLKRFESIIRGCLKNIYVGQFEKLISKDYNALYEDGNMYLSNEQLDDDDLIDDIVHELAHCIEQSKASNIYDDKRLQKEFLFKRNQLYNKLKHKYTVDKSFFENPNYDLKFDMFLYSVVGYDNLESDTKNIFNTPYAATCIREYFATGVEEFILGLDSTESKLYQMCPTLFMKIASL